MNRKANRIPAEPPGPHRLSTLALLKIGAQLGMAPPAQTFSGADFTGSIVYAWMRGSECLYVGQSVRGLARIFSTHHVIKNVQPDDTIKVWKDCGDNTRRRKIEDLLIQYLRPKFNKAGTVPWAEPATAPIRVAPPFRSKYWQRRKSS